MKKLKKILRFCVISAVVLVFWIGLCHVLFKLIWNFDILSREPYLVLYNYWEQGGVFNTLRDCSLGVSLFLMPVLWLLFSYKLYKYGLGKFLLMPFVKLYRRITRPKDIEAPHVPIKNLGGKDRSLNEIISEKLEIKGEKQAPEHTTRDLRRQIAAKIEENEKQ